MAAHKQPKTKPRRPHQLRIIGGQWRGRRLSFPDVEGLRPTPDRVRETLFNWLAPVIEGARCLDLFTGSGALGLEALSRGAAEAVMVDRDPQVITHLKENIATLSAPGATLVVADALPWLQSPHQKSTFDIVFLDPPFRQNLIALCIERLEDSAVLASGAHIYMETESDLPAPSLSNNWRMLREKKAGQVGYYLAVRE